MAGKSEQENPDLPDYIRFQEEIKRSPFLSSLVHAEELLHQASEWPMPLNTLTGPFYAKVLGFETEKMAAAVDSFTANNLIQTTQTTYEIQREGFRGRLPAVSRTSALAAVALCRVLADDFKQDSVVNIREVALKTRVKLHPLTLAQAIQKPHEEDSTLVVNPLFANPEIERKRQDKEDARESPPMPIFQPKTEQEAFEDALAPIQRLITLPSFQDEMSLNEMTQRPTVLKALGLNTKLIGPVLKLYKDAGIVDPQMVKQMGGTLRRQLYTKDQIVAVTALSYVLRTAYRNVAEVSLSDLVTKTRDYLGDSPAVASVTDPKDIKRIVENPFIMKKTNEIEEKDEKQEVKRQLHALTTERMAELLAEGLPSADVITSLSQLPINQTDIDKLLELRRLTYKGVVLETVTDIQESLKLAYSVLRRRPHATLDQLLSAAKQNEK